MGYDAAALTATRTRIDTFDGARAALLGAASSRAVAATASRNAAAWELKEWNAGFLRLLRPIVRSQPDRRAALEL